MLGMFIIGAAGAHYFWTLSETKPFFADYTFIEQDQGCHFHIKDDDSHDNQNNYKEFKARILGSGLDCKKYPWVYFPVSKTLPGLSVFVCQKEYITSSQAGCITLSFRGVDSE